MYKFQHSNTIKYGTSVQYVCVNRDQSRLEYLELLLFLTVNLNVQVVSVLQSIEIQHQIFCNLQSGCPATWKTRKCQGIPMQEEKVREKSGNLNKNKESQGKVREFCCVKFIFSQSGHRNFETFLGGAPGPP